ncbi:MAG: hypothetical protein K2M68_01225 [Muribaculaceae bacterium]|nr:hypothetical protein [Muribaculaceae bacterium]
MWAFICTTAPLVCANQPTDIDSIESSISPLLLDVVVVKASPVINKTDGKVIRPDKEMLRMSTDGVDLLRKLQLSRITVNPLTNNIEVVGGGDVLLCINGIESTSAQIAAIRPQDIIRIEYHDNPGIRYGAATIVIDYITSRHQSGGNLNIDAFEAIAGGRFASIDNLAGQYNHGRSVWSANISYFGQQKDKWQRDYDETWNYPDATLVRHEEGLPVTVSAHRLESTINYNYQLPTGDIFNARLGFNLNDVPNKEEGDRMAWLQTSGSVDPILVAEHTEEHLIQPNVGLFYQHNMSGGQSLIFDTQGSYLQSRMSHKYSENGVGEDSRVFGDKYSLKLLSMYENRTGSRLWSVAVSNNLSLIQK